MGAGHFKREPEPLKKIKGANAGDGNVKPIYREPEPVNHLKTAPRSQESESRAFVEGFGAGAVEIYKNGSQEPGERLYFGKSEPRAGTGSQTLIKSKYLRFVYINANKVSH